MMQKAPQCTGTVPFLIHLLFLSSWTNAEAKGDKKNCRNTNHDALSKTIVSAYTARSLFNNNG